MMHRLQRLLATVVEVSVMLRPQSRSRHPLQVFVIMRCQLHAEVCTPSSGLHRLQRLRGPSQARSAAPMPPPTAAFSVLTPSVGLKRMRVHSSPQPSAAASSVSPAESASCKSRCVRSVHSVQLSDDASSSPAASEPCVWTCPTCSLRVTAATPNLLKHARYRR